MSDRDKSGSGGTGGARHGRQRRALLCAAIAIVAGLAFVFVSADTANTGRRPASAAQVAVPRAPAGLAIASGSGGSVLLTWRPVRPYPVGYRIYRADTSDGRYAIVGEVNAPNIGAFTDTVDLVPDVTYAYTVTAYTRAAESAPAGPVVAVLIPERLPSPAPTPALQPPPTFAVPAPPTLTALARAPGGTAGTPAPTIAALPFTPLARVAAPALGTAPAASPGTTVQP